MFKSNFIRIRIIVLIEIFGLFITLINMENPPHLFVILIGVFFIVTAMIVLQVIYFYKFYTDDRKDQELRMKKCVECDAPLYKTAEVCPYCKTKQ